MKLIYVCDDKRHLICVPYSVENLHIMAEQLNIKKHWFHKNHYDIPKRRIDEITKKCKVVNMRLIVDIINRPDLAGDLISSATETENEATPKDRFTESEFKYEGYD